jgi:hypothetical protein
MKRNFNFSSIKDIEFCDDLSNCQLFEKDSFPRNQLINTPTLKTFVRVYATLLVATVFRVCIIRIAATDESEALRKVAREPARGGRVCMVLWL